MNYSTTNRDGYREYKSNPEICRNCPSRHLCTASKDCVKTVTKHIWHEYIERCEDIRQTPEYAELYKERKEKIERVFADAKEKHAMRYTPYRGLNAVTNWVRLKFAAMNLKKLALWKAKSRKLQSSDPVSASISDYCLHFLEILMQIMKPCSDFCRNMAFSTDCKRQGTHI